MIRRGLAIAAVATAACVSQSSAPPEAVSAGDEAQEEAAAYARSSAKDVYRALRRGKIDLSQSLLAEDAFVVGPRPGDVFTTRTDAVVAMTSEFDAGDRTRVRSKGLVAEGAMTGKSAWIIDRVDVARTRYSVVGVMAQIDEIWYVVALHVGGTSAGEGAPAPLSGGVGAAGEVVDLVRAGAADPALFVEQLSDRKKVTVVGPGRKDHLRGRKKIERTWIKKKKAPAPFELFGDVRAGVTPDGGVAWVLAYTRDADALRRSMFVYERTDDTWRLVTIQHAAAPKADGPQ